ncbi:unnamed protein product [Acanthoscelides obtectus]|uniref:LIM zinc-binding domain-containing protein n=2 Tax=Acanthoscelides obtectus TaxID=200917 RepID=A0A9P0M3T5_ACAOB|nr:unnamed protein product [Acanthoscelides obtectus]CAK1662738.1 Xin actin-binding repeat-containing protein 2 [Acanthoscelides obtectus]
MADTVKKSRIVSDDDDNLEETLLEEFNMRLKSCMSKDDLQLPDEEQEQEDSTALPPPTEGHYASPPSPPRPFPAKGAEESTALIESERQANFENNVENIYETLPEKTAPHCEDQYVDMVHPTIEIQDQEENVIEEENSDLADTSYEVVDANRPSFSLNKTDLSMDEPGKSVKSMFLNTDDAAATLLFTQTVTSPMLTPSEENIDFLKGFQRENTNSDNTTVSEDSPPKEDNSTDVSAENSASEPAVEPLKENIYENAEIIKKQPSDLYENLKPNSVKENIYENVREFMDEHIYQDIEESGKNDVEESIKKDENLYENLEELKKNLPDEVMIENSLYTSDDITSKEEVDTSLHHDGYEVIRADEIFEIQTEHCKITEEHSKIVEKHTDYSEVIENKIIEVVANNGSDTSSIKSETYSISPEKFSKNNDTLCTNLSANGSDIFETQENNTNGVDTKRDVLENHNSETVETRNGAIQNGTSAESLKSNTDVIKTTNGDLKESYTEFIHHSKSESNYYEKYTEVVSKSLKVESREKDTETVPPEIVKNLKNQFLKTGVDAVATNKKELGGVTELRTVNILNKINKFEHKDGGDSSYATEEEDSTVTETYSETTTIQSGELQGGEEKCLKKKKTKKSRKEEKENISVKDAELINGDCVYNVNVKSLCRSFGDLTKLSGEDRLSNRQKNKTRTRSLTNVLLGSNKKIENVFTEVSVRALKEKFNIVENKNPLGIVKTPFKSALKSSFSKFDALQKKNVLHVRSLDSTKAQEKFNGTQQIDTTNCKACSKAVFQMEQIKAEKAIWHKNCFRCTECSKQLTVETYVSHEGNLYCKPHFKSLFAPKVIEDEAPPSDKPDLGLEELQSLNVKERFQVFEQHQTEVQEQDRGPTPVNVKRSQSILSKLARFQAKGMDVGVPDDALNGIPIEESSSEEEEEEEVPEGEDPTLYKAKRAQKEKPFHFTNMHEVKNKWEQGEQHSKEERREERKQEIQSIRNKLFMGKQVKMKEAYQQAVMQSESCANLHKPEEKIECDTKSLKERFEKGELYSEKEDHRNGDEENEVYQSEISKKSRSLFLELDANASKPPQMTPVTPPKVEVRKARESDTPEREIYHDPDIVRAEDYVDDSVIAKTTHTASKMLNKFRQMEENLTKEPEPAGPKPLKRFTPPPEPARPESDSGEEESEEEEEDEIDNQKLPQDLVEAQKAARAKQLTAKFEKWEAQEIKREQTHAVNIVEEYGEESQIESTRSLRQRFEQMRETSSDKTRKPLVKVNRFVEIPPITEACESCGRKVYPLEKISVHGHIYHKGCFKCMECACVLRMDSYSYNQGLLYCTPHFKRLFITKGNYDSAFGLNQHKEKWNMKATVA